MPHSKGPNARPSVMPVGSRRRGICHGCGIETVLRKRTDGWTCLDCGHVHGGRRFPARPRRGPVQDSRISELHRAGRTVTQIAAEVGQSYSNVIRRLERLGLEPRRTRRPYTDTSRMGGPGKPRVDVPAELLALYPEISPKEIARRAGCGVPTIYRRLHDAGIETGQRYFIVPRPPHHVHIARSHEAHRKAVLGSEMRGRGLSYGQIAVRLGYRSSCAARKAIVKYEAGQLLVQRLGLVEATVAA